MKIAINIEHFSANKGGAERYASGLAKSLADKGHELHILACSWYDGCEKEFCCHKIPKSLFRTFRDLRFARASQKELQKEKYDLCLSFTRSINPGFYLPHGGVHRAYLKRELQSHSNPLIKVFKFLVNITSLRHFLIKRLEGKVFSNPNLIVVAISKMVKEDILSFYSFPEKNIKVIYNGVDLEMFNPDQNKKAERGIRSRYNIDNKTLLILFVANNFRLKGLTNLVNAAGLMKKKMKNFHVLILGSDNKLPYEILSGRLGCRRNFTFIGKTSEVEKFYASADVLAQPTFYDACSLVTLESMASGLPVVTSSQNGASELIENGVDGFVLEDTQDYALLSQKLMLFSDKNLKEGMGKNARKKIEKYSLQRNSQEMLALCEEACIMKTAL